jgi:hypothetical protein
MKPVAQIFIAAFLLSLVVPPANSADTPASGAEKAVLEPVGKGWEPLIGKTLGGWKAEPEFWKVEDGVLHGVTPGTQQHHYAYTETNYGDFELHADVKLVGNNSGICIRIAPQNFDSVPGYQVDMGDGYWGCLWEEHGRGKVVSFPKADADKLVKKGDWNHYYVRAEKHHIQAWLNGVKTIDVVDDKGLLTGPIGFQLCHGVGKMTDASFKNVVFRPIKTAE